MRQSPQVLDGLRAGRDTPGRVVPGVTQSEPGLYARIASLLRGKNLIVDRAEKTPYQVVFASRYSALRVQVTAPEDQVDGKTGHKTKGRPICVKFANSMYSVPKKHTPAEAQLIVDWLRDHQQYKIDFWEQQDMANEATIRKAVSVIEAVSGDEKIRETVLEFLTGQTDFVEDQTTTDSALGSTVVDDEDQDEDEDLVPDSGDDMEDGGEGQVEDEPESKPTRKKPGTKPGSQRTKLKPGPKPGSKRKK